MEKLETLEFSALLASRLCHDLISPIGALNNGLELLAEGGDEEMQQFANELIEKSAKAAAIKLKYARLAFGAHGKIGKMGDEIDINEAKQIASELLAQEKPTLNWQGESFLMAKNKIKLLLNMLLIAIASVPRGGEINVIAEKNKFEIIANGAKAKVPTEFIEMLDNKGEENLTPLTVQFHYTLLLANSENLTINIDSAVADKIIFAVN